MRRDRFFIQELLVVKIMRAATLSGEETFAMAILCTYIFLLRLPSECLPIAVHCSGRPDGCPAALTCKDNTLTLDLKRRKNRPGGSRLTRLCWCRDSPETCLVHVLGAFVSKFEDGERPFGQWTASKVLERLRGLLADLGIENARLYRTHDIRRGHARDLQQRGASLKEILSAGEWQSPAFFAYLELEELERDTVVKATFSRELRIWRAIKKGVVN